jgi:hypothetical protein
VFRVLGGRQTTRAREQRERERDLRQKSFGDGVNKSTRKDVDAMEEEKARSERLVGRDCEQRRYLFRAHFAEIESNRREVFVWSE